MAYLIKINASAEKELEKLPEKTQDKIFLKIESLAENPRPQGVKKLKAFNIPGFDVEKYYRIRSGNYRIIYAIDDDIITVTIVAIGNRKDIYK
jgi:mRNA interferase RelE/StbE